MPRQPVTYVADAAPIGPFSVAVTGPPSLFLSGQVAQDPSTGTLIDGNAVEQARQVLRNVEGS